MRDLRLVGAVVDAERVLAVRHQRVALLGDDRLDDHLARHPSARPPLARLLGCARSTSPTRASSASRARLRRRPASAWPIRSATPRRRRPASTSTRGDVAEALQRRRPPRRSRTTSVGRLRAPLRERLGGLLGRRARRSVAASSTAIAAARGVHAERRAQRPAARLAVDLEGVAARLGAERDAAAAAVRDAERAGAGAAGALLAPGLGAVVIATSPRVSVECGAAAARVQVGARGLVDERLVEVLAEDGRRAGRPWPACRARRLGRGLLAIAAHLHGAVRAGRGPRP